VADLGFNTASTGIDYYDGEQFPAEYQGNFFITLWGSLDYAPEPTGRTLVRAVNDETPEGPQATVEEFGTGFQRPIDVVVDRDGALLVLDSGRAELYGIAHIGS
jgi:glucose/arabinose dehydrogenase